MPIAVSLLDTLSFNVNEMYLQGVATRNDCLSVEVKSSEARLAQLKANNGLSLAKMALAQLCGFEITDNFEIADNLSQEDELSIMANSVDMESIYDKRPDIRALSEVVDLSRQNERLALSDMLPKLVVVGAYAFTNPNLINGFENRFGGGFSVGATLSIPLWHWGGNYNKLRSAKAQTAVSRLVLEDAEEMVELQVRQAELRFKEAESAVMIANKNLSLAEENMRLNFGDDFKHEAVAADAVEYIKQIGNKYDLIILDPPAFAKHHKVLGNAMQGYKRINARALSQIKRGGILFTFSCSQAVSKELFRTTVFSAAAIAGRKVRILHQLTQPADHPINIYHPEGEYLKGLVLYVE